MALQRIRFNTSASPSGSYTIPVNPSSLDLNEDVEQNNFRFLDGGQAIQQSYFDARSIALSWTHIPKGLITNFGTMLTTLKGYVGKKRYIHWGDIDYSVPTLGWTQYRVSDLQVKIEPGGRIKHNVTLVVFPEQ